MSATLKKALLCVGNPLRGDDDVANELGRLVLLAQNSSQLSGWRVFFGEDVPENEFGNIREYAPDIIVVADAVSGFKQNIDFLDLSDEKDYIYSTHNLPAPVLLSYLRKISPRTIFLGIGVLLENVLEFKEGLSDDAKNSAKIALDKLKTLDAML